MSPPEEDVFDVYLGGRDEHSLRSISARRNIPGSFAQGASIFEYAL